MPVSPTVCSGRWVTFLEGFSSSCSLPAPGRTALGTVQSWRCCDMEVINLIFLVETLKELQLSFIMALQSSGIPQPRSPNVVPGFISRMETLMDDVQRDAPGSLARAPRTSVLMGCLGNCRRPSDGKGLISLGSGPPEDEVGVPPKPFSLHRGLLNTCV